MYSPLFGAIRLAPPLPPRVNIHFSMTHKIAAVWWFYEPQSWLLMTAIHFISLPARPATTFADVHTVNTLHTRLTRPGLTCVCAYARLHESHLRKKLILFVRFRRTFFQYVSLKKNSCALFVFSLSFAYVSHPFLRRACVCSAHTQNNIHWTFGLDTHYTLSRLHSDAQRFSHLLLLLLLFNNHFFFFFIYWLCDVPPEQRQKDDEKLRAKKWRNEATTTEHWQRYVPLLGMRAHFVSFFVACRRRRPRCRIFVAWKWFKFRLNADCKSGSRTVTFCLRCTRRKQQKEKGVSCEAMRSSKCHQKRIFCAWLLCIWPQRVANKFKFVWNFRFCWHKKQPFYCECIGNCLRAETKWIIKKNSLAHSERPTALSPFILVCLGRRLCFQSFDGVWKTCKPTLYLATLSIGCNILIVASAIVASVGLCVAHRHSQPRMEFGLRAVSVSATEIWLLRSLSLPLSLSIAQIAHEDWRSILIISDFNRNRKFI